MTASRLIRNPDGARTFLSNAARNWHRFRRVFGARFPWNLRVWRNLFGMHEWLEARRGGACAAWEGELCRFDAAVASRNEGWADAPTSGCTSLAAVRALG